MRHNFKLPKTTHTCGPFSIQACLKEDGINREEDTIKKICHTTKKEGTNERDMVKACKYFGYVVKSGEIVSTSRFVNRIIKGLEVNHRFIVASEAGNHWFAVLRYYKRRRLFKIVDGDYYQIVKKSVLQYIKLHQLLKTSFNYDKFTDKEYYYFLELSREE